MFYLSVFFQTWLTCLFRTTMVLVGVLQTRIPSLHCLILDQPHGQCLCPTSFRFPTPTTCHSPSILDQVLVVRGVSTVVSFSINSSTNTFQWLESLTFLQKMCIQERNMTTTHFNILPKDKAWLCEESIIYCTFSILFVLGFEMHHEALFQEPFLSPLTYLLTATAAHNIVFSIFVFAHYCSMLVF